MSAESTILNHEGHTARLVHVYSSNDCQAVLQQDRLL